MKEVKVFIEIAPQGFSAYMDDTPLDYGCMGEGSTVKEAMEDFNRAYEEMREHYAAEGRPFEEVNFSFYYDTASFLNEFGKVFSLSGLQRITGINQTQLGHYLHGRSRPSRKTIIKIQDGIRRFVNNLAAVNFL